MKNIEIDKLCIDSNSTIRHAMQTIGNGEIGVAFVVDESQALISLLTDGDVRRALLVGYGLQSKVSLIQVTAPVVANINDSAADVLTKFNDKIRIIPVLDEFKRIIDIHFVDKRSHIAVTNPLFDETEIELLNECIVSGWVSSGGPFVTKFESMMSSYCGTNYAISCSSGTSGLHLALLACGIGPGDEVIVPSLTFVATANAVSYTGATPVFVDSEINTWNIDPALITNAITKNTKAIIPVHLYGHPADMDEINKIAVKHDLMVIEDAAEAQGAKYKEKMVGALGDIAVFSYFGNKIITTGEGGMIVTNNADLAEKCQVLRDHGMSKNRRYWHDVIGYNYRMTNMQAALGVAQMGKIDRILTRKKEIAKEYSKHLETVPGISLPSNMEWADNVYWLYTIYVENIYDGFNVDVLMGILKEKGIDSRPVFPPVHTQPIYKTEISLPISEKISLNGISLPSAPDIKNEDIKLICNVLESYLSEMCVIGISNTEL